MKSEQYKNYYDIVILPSAEVRDVAIAASQKIYRKLGSDLVLGKQSFKPHISLYHVTVTKKNFSEMVRRLRVIGGRLKVGPLAILPYKNQPHLAVTKIAWLQNLHQSVLVAINPLRDKTFSDAWDNGAKYGNIVKSVHRKNIQKYGSPIVGKIFDPHITLTVLNDLDDRVRATQTIPLKKYKFIPTAITICQIGKYHSCQKIIATIPFAV